MKFYTSVAKGLKVKVIKFWGLVATFIEVTEEKTGSGGEGGFLPPPIPVLILNRVKAIFSIYFFKVGSIFLDLKMVKIHLLFQFTLKLYAV